MNIPCIALDSVIGRIHGNGSGIDKSIQELFAYISSENHLLNSYSLIVSH